MKNPLEVTTTMKSLVWAGRGVRTKRESSWDRTGGNVDSRPIPPGETLTVAELKGPGCITHIWCTIAAEDKHYLRSLVLRIWWDGEKTPSVECPIGDFFGMGHARMRPYQCYPFYTSNGGGNEGDFSSMNCYFQMPFGTSARITVENQGPNPVGAFYYYVDYETYQQPLPEDALRFHCQWRRENPTRPIKGHLADKGINYWSLRDEPNLDGKENYVILDAEGRGRYVGCNLSVDNYELLTNGTCTWWGEGDDMIYIDGEKLPSMVGTGSEDYFCHAWGMQNNAGLYAGTSIFHTVPKSGGGGKFTCYRFHIEDPVYFEKSVKVTIEHGHANLQEHDYASTAYWYQTEPHKPFPALPPREARLPRPDVVIPVPERPKASANVKDFIRDWMVLGPFANEPGPDGAKGIETLYPPERKAREWGTAKALKAVYEGVKGTPIQWQPLEPRHVREDGFVNLASAIGGNWCVAYLMTKIHAKKARALTLWVGSDDGCKVWLNGTVVHDAPAPRGPEPDNDKIPVTLKQGENVLVIKVEQHTGQWGAYARLDEGEKRTAKKPKRVLKDLDSYT